MALKQSIWDIIHNSLPGIVSLNMGMNIPAQNYYSAFVPHVDIQLTASHFTTSNNSYAWNSGMASEIPLLESGYPVELPIDTSDGYSTWSRYMISNQVVGDYIIYIVGTGTLGGGASLQGDGYYHVNLSGTGSNVWVDILTSDVGDPITEIRILPASYGIADEVPLFKSEVVTALTPFNVLRFLDYTQTNDNTLSTRRVLPTDFERSEKGAPYEYVIELCNQTNSDCYINIPHMASDAYITEMATVFKANLDPSLNLYIEYSNELWNWIFGQANWVLDNATDPPAVDTYVTSDLATIGPIQTNHPEKDAYMHARLFRLWDAVWGADMSRVTRVAPVQASYTATTERICEYLFNTDGIGADALAPTAYFAFKEEQHLKWLEDTANGVLTQEMMYNDMLPRLLQSETTLANKVIADTYGIPLVSYEGGQHMQSWGQNNQPYDQILWDFQVSNYMYELYKLHFENLAKPEVDLQLFMAFDFMRERESEYGSWGHLEYMDQLGEVYATVAPKYQALLDFAKE